MNQEQTEDESLASDADRLDNEIRDCTDWSRLPALNKAFAATIDEMMRRRDARHVPRLPPHKTTPSRRVKRDPFDD